MNFEDLMKETSDMEDPKTEPLELPNEPSNERSEELLKELSDEVEESGDCQNDAPKLDMETLKELVESGKMMMSWTKVNTSKWCGCNNACFNSCFNIG